MYRQHDQDEEDEGRKIDIKNMSFSGSGRMMDNNYLHTKNKLGAKQGKQGTSRDNVDTENFRSAHYQTICYNKQYQSPERPDKRILDARGALNSKGIPIQNEENNFLVKSYSPFKATGRDQKTALSMKHQPEISYDNKYHPKLEVIKPQTACYSMNKNNIPRLFDKITRDSEKKYTQQNFHQTKSTKNSPIKRSETHNQFFQGDNQGLDQQNYQQQSPQHKTDGFNYSSNNSKHDFKFQKLSQTARNFRESPKKVQTMDAGQNFSRLRKQSLTEEQRLYQERQFNNFNLRDAAKKRGFTIDFGVQSNRQELFQTREQKENQIKYMLGRNQVKPEHFETVRLVREKQIKQLNGKLKYFKEIMAKKPKFQSVGKIIKPKHSQIKELSNFHQKQNEFKEIQGKFSSTLNNITKKEALQLQFTDQLIGFKPKKTKQNQNKSVDSSYQNNYTNGIKKPKMSITNFDIPKEHDFKNIFKEPKQVIDRSYRYRQILEKNSKAKYAKEINQNEDD